MKRDLREGEFVVVSVTPVSRGVLGPAIAVVAAAATVVAVVNTWSWPHQHSLLLALVCVGPFAVVLGGRLWRWRSHKIVVTSQRIIQHGGVAQRHRSAIELIDIHASHVDQRWYERLTRRGHVILDTPVGPYVLERVRRPDALWRVIDHQRQSLDRHAATQLDRADELSRALEEGLLTDEEYDVRWRHLFGPDGPRR